MVPSRLPSMPNPLHRSGDCDVTDKQHKAKSARGARSINRTRRSPAHIQRAGGYRQRPGQQHPTMRATDSPAVGLNYSQLMHRPGPDNGIRALSGIFLVAAGLGVMNLVISYLGVLVSWLARGKQGSFKDSYLVTVSYGRPEGIVIVNLAAASAIAVVLIVARFYNRMKVGWLISVKPGMRWGYLTAALIVALVVLNGVYLLGPAGTSLHWQPASRPGLLMALVVLTTPLQAAGEEFVFRGYLQQAIGALAGRSWIGLVLSALVFAALHGSQNAPLFMDRLGFGLIAGGMVLATGGLEASIAVHAVNNVSAFGYAIAGGTLVQTRQISGAAWTTSLSNVAGYLLTAAAVVGLARLFHLQTRTAEPPIC